jgi:hypothetical protein
MPVAHSCDVIGRTGTHPFSGQIVQSDWTGRGFATNAINQALQQVEHVQSIDLAKGCLLP